MLGFCCCIVSLLIGGSLAGIEGGKPAVLLNISYITAISGPGVNVIGARPVIDLALEEINNRTDILQNYTLNYTTVHDSMCNRTKSLTAFFHDFPCRLDKGSCEVHNIAILGCGCSIATLPVAEISHFWNIPQISFAASDRRLRDRTRFKNLFSTFPSFDLNPAALARFFEQFGWRQAAIISQAEPIFMQVTMELRRIFNERNWTIYETRLPSITYPDHLNQSFPYIRAFDWMEQRHDYRIIFINTYQEYAYLILCRAYELNLFPPRYTWITPVWLNDQWWISVGSKLSFACPSLEVEQMLIGSFGSYPDGFLVRENPTAKSFSQQTRESFFNEYTRRLTLPEYVGLEYSQVAGLAYDAVWSLGIGLNIASDRVLNPNHTAVNDGCEKLPGNLVPLEQFEYSNIRMGCVLRHSMSQVDFMGITGRITYNSVGIRPGNTFIFLQYRETNGSVERVKFADVTFSPSGAHFTFKNGEKASTVWKYGVPYDGSVRFDIHENSDAVGGIFYTLSGLGLIFAFCCFLFNMIFRNKPVMKLSSPNLNNLIILGAMLLYISICLFVMPISTQNLATIICNVRLWIFSIAYNLCFAVILAKAWRIFYIFTNPTTKKKVVKDWLLMLVIMIIVAGDLIMLTIGTAVPGSRLQGELVRDKEEFKLVSADGVNEEHYVYICSTGHSIVLFSFLFIYKGLLQVVAIFMAFNTRKIKIKALNDSKAVTTIIYINSIILILMAVSSLLLEAYHHVFAVLFGLALFIQATVFLGLLFIPKAIILYKDPNSENICATDTTSGRINTPRNNGNQVNMSLPLSSVVHPQGGTAATNNHTAKDKEIIEEIKKQVKIQEADLVSTEKY